MCSLPKPRPLSRVYPNTSLPRVATSLARGNPSPACHRPLVLTLLRASLLSIDRLWQAREEIPADPTIWFAAAKLEEAQGNASLAATIINRAPAKLRKNNGVVSRDDWLKVRCW